MNINAMGGSSLSGRYPSTIGWTFVDQIVWAIRQIFIAGTARGLLEMVFGAGMIVTAMRSLRHGTPMMAIRRNCVRCLLLVLIGLVHVFWLGWFGDFLHIYGLVALVVFPLSQLRVRWSIAIGSVYAVALAMGGVVSLVTGTPVLHGHVGAPFTLPPVAGRFDTLRVPERDHAAILAENHERSTTPSRWTAALVRVYATHFDWGWVRYGLGEAGATMLIGAALFKMRVLQGERSRAFYWRLASAGYCIGLAIRLPGAWNVVNAGTAMPLIDALAEIGRLSMTLGHVATLALILETPRWRGLLRPLSAVGRMSLTIYLSQTVICLWVVFSPLGLGLYGRMGWAGLMATGVAIDVGLIVAATVYLRHYRIGPIEWVWRSLIASRVLPLVADRPLTRASATN